MEQSEFVKATRNGIVVRVSENVRKVFMRKVVERSRDLEAPQVVNNDIQTSKTMEKKVTLEVDKSTYYWSSKVKRGGKLVAKADRSMIEVDESWIYIYKPAGSPSYGISRGQLIRKIYIGNCEFEEVEIRSSASGEQ